MRTPTYRRRPYRPRRRPSRLAKSARVLAVLAVACVCILLVKAAVMKAARPYVISYGESKESTEIQQQIDAATSENKALREQIAFLSTNKGKEIEARKLGWVKPGEVSLLIQPKAGVPENDFITPPKDPSLVERAVRGLVGLFVREEGHASEQ